MSWHNFDLNKSEPCQTHVLKLSDSSSVLTITTWRGECSVPIRFSCAGSNLLFWHEPQWRPPSAAATHSITDPEKICRPCVQHSGPSSQSDCSKMRTLPAVPQYSASPINTRVCTLWFSSPTGQMLLLVLYSSSSCDLNHRCICNVFVLILVLTWNLFYSNG